MSVISTVKVCKNVKTNSFNLTLHAFLSKLLLDVQFVEVKMNVIL